jgi:membrane-associated phospholipid phosphatase
MNVCLPFIMGLFITMFLTSLLKEIIKAPRPPEYPEDTKEKNITYSFPSGHSATITYILSYLYLKEPTLIKALIFSIIWYKVAYGRYIDGYHRLSEVIAGTILGGFVSIKMISSISNL